MSVQKNIYSSLSFSLSFRIRIPMFVGSILFANQFGGDRSQTISNVLCYGFIGFLLLERGIDRKVDTLTTETGEIH